MSKMLCLSEVVKDENGDDYLRIDVPFNRDLLKKTLDNCNPDKNSVTLVNGDIVSQIVGRQALSQIVDIGPYTVELKGGVNIYVTRPKQAGKSQAALQYEKAATAEVAIAQAAEAAKWAILPAPLLNPAGEVIQQAGSRMEKATLGDMLDKGYTFQGISAE